jgi:short-subunit dehydrogenase
VIVPTLSPTSNVRAVLAEELAGQDYHVIVTARNGAQAEEQAATLRGEGHSAEGLRLDLFLDGERLA